MSYDDTIWQTAELTQAFLEGVRGAIPLALVETQCHWLHEIGFKEVDCFLKIFELALFGGIK